MPASTERSTNNEVDRRCGSKDELESRHRDFFERGFKIALIFSLLFGVAALITLVVQV